MTNVSLHRFGKMPRQFSKVAGAMMSAFVVGAIASLPALSQSTDSDKFQPVRASFTTLPSLLEATETFWDVAVANIPGLLTVTIYMPPETCDGYVSKKQAIVENEAVSQTISYLLTKEIPDLINFKLAGYRVIEGEDNKVTIDFRRKPDTERQFVSLSACEQQIIFGSLRQTLLENPVLGIKNIQFTEQGRPIRL